MAKEDKFADKVMIDEELDQVAGGGTRQCIGDARFLNSFGALVNIPTNQSIVLNW